LVMVDLSKSELKLITKALMVLMICHDAITGDAKNYNKIETLHNKAEGLIKEA
jgi:hypothetical protein